MIINDMSKDVYIPRKSDLVATYVGEVKSVCDAMIEALGAPGRRDPAIQALVNFVRIHLFEGRHVESGALFGPAILPSPGGNPDLVCTIEGVPIYRSDFDCGPRGLKDPRTVIGNRIVQVYGPKTEYDILDLDAQLSRSFRAVEELTDFLRVPPPDAEPVKQVVEEMVAHGITPDELRQLKDGTASLADILSSRGIELEPELTPESLAKLPVTVARAELSRLKMIEGFVANALNQKGDDVCWRDIYNPEVAGLVGVDDFDPQLLPEARFVEGNCRHFYKCLADGTPYKTPAGPDAAALAAILNRLHGASPLTAAVAMFKTVAYAGDVESGFDDVIGDEAGNMTVLSLINTLLKPTGTLVCSIHDDETGFLTGFGTIPVANVTFTEESA